MFYNNNLMLLIALPLSSSYLLLSTLLKHTQYLKVGMSKKKQNLSAFDHFEVSDKCDLLIMAVIHLGLPAPWY